MNKSQNKYNMKLLLDYFYCLLLIIMWFITWLLKTTLNVVTVPLSILWDVYDGVTEKNQFRESKTEEKFKKIWDNLEDTFNWELL